MGSSAQRMKADAKRTGRKSGTLPKDQQFVQLINAFRAEPAWRALTYGARCLYIEMKALTTPYTNGRVQCSVRYAAGLLGCSRSSAERFLGELQDHGFIVPTAPGALGVEGHGRGTLWRLTEIGRLGERPTMDYKRWRPDKLKSPSAKSGRTVPEIGTAEARSVPDAGTGCPENRDGPTLKSTPECPENKDNIHIPGGAGEKGAPAGSEATRTPRSFVIVGPDGTRSRVGVRTGRRPQVRAGAW